MQYDCFKGHDYGGHNIPNPAPAPPKPQSSIYSYPYIDFSKMSDEEISKGPAVEVRQLQINGDNESP